MNHAKKLESVENWKDVSDFFLRTGLKSSVSCIQETPDMYPFKNEIEQNWSYFSALTFAKLGLLKHFKPRSMAIIGIGNGLEGIAAVTAFPSLKKLFISDVEEKVTLGAYQNISQCVKEIEITTLNGSLCEPLIKADQKVDLVFANIPNLLTDNIGDDDLGESRGTFIQANLLDRYFVPFDFSSWALGGQYALLKSAKQILRPAGSLITALGGRVPFPLIADLFSSCGYSFHEELIGFKLQTETLIDLEGYASLESQFGVQFTFYQYENALRLLNDVGFASASDSISGQELSKILAPSKLSASKALKEFKSGKTIGHIVLLLRSMIR